MSLSNVNGNGMRINVEIDNLVQGPFDYIEVYLRFNGEKSRYKMIVRKGVLIAIVKRGYKLIPHELVDRVLAEIPEIRMEKRHEEGGRCYWECSIDGRKDAGLLIENSIDGSLTLSAKLFILFGDGVARVLVTNSSKKLVSDFKKVHKKSANVGELPKIVSELVGSVDKVKDWVERVFALRALDYKDVWDMVKEDIPEKYTRQILAKLYATPNNNITVGEVYRDIARRVWSNPKTDMNTKMMFIQRLNEALWIIGEGVAFG